MKKKTTNLAILAISLILLLSILTSNVQQAKANPGCVTITVQYVDGYPRSNAFVQWSNNTDWHFFGSTDETGTKILCNHLAPGFYTISAWYPDLATQFGVNRTLEVNATGDGSKTIQEDYNSIEIHSPENKIYNTSYIPLNFTFHNSSTVFWMGYSLDGNQNETIETPTITNLGTYGILVNATTKPITNGQHNITVYATDIYGHTGSSNTVDFTVNVEHNIAVTNITLSRTIVCQNLTMFINVTVENQGLHQETFNVTAYANTTSVGTQTVDNMSNGISTILNFVWNTTGFAKGVYIINANATAVTNETYIDDNSFTDGTVRVTMMGDVKPAWGKVNIFDVRNVAKAYGSAAVDDPETPWDDTVNWNPNVNLAPKPSGDGKIDIFDIRTCARYYSP